MWWTTFIPQGIDVLGPLIALIWGISIFGSTLPQFMLFGLLGPVEWGTITSLWMCPFLCGRSSPPLQPFVPCPHINPFQVIVLVFIVGSFVDPFKNLNPNGLVLPNMLLLLVGHYLVVSFLLLPYLYWFWYLRLKALFIVYYFLSIVWFSPLNTHSRSSKRSSTSLLYGWCIYYTFVGLLLKEKPLTIPSG